MPRVLTTIWSIGLGLALAIPAARAGTVDCTGNPAALAATAFTPGGSYEIAGNCVGDVTITAGNVTLENADSSAIDSITGTVTVVGARNVTLLGNAGGNFLGLQIQGAGADDGQPAGLHVTARASVTLDSVEISAPQENGILVEQNATALVTDSVVASAGRAGDPGRDSGIVVQDGATVVLETSADAVVATQISNSAGYEILATTGNLIVNGANGFSVSSSELGAISASAGSHLRLVGGIGGGTITAQGTAPTIFLAGSSSLFMQAVAVFGAQTDVPVIQVSTGSSFQSAGELAICNAACDPSGIAVQIDHGSSMVELSGSPADDISGAGMVQEQSSMELGTGASTPSSWSGTITVQQNSAFRMSGGMSIAGQVILEQASNGFFNTLNGGAGNGVSGGVSCPFTAIPAAHVSGPTKAIPPVATSASPLSTLSPTCLGF